MKTTELAREMRQATALLHSMLGGDQLDERFRSKCRAVGEIDARTIEICELIGVARIAFDGNRGRWRPAAGNEPGCFAFVTPVLIDHPDAPWSAEPFFTVRFGEIVDLVAWDPEQPTWWALRCGTGAWLGAVGPATLRTPVWDTIAEWLRADLAGIVILTRDRRERMRLLRLVPQPQFPALAA